MKIRIMVMMSLLFVLSYGMTGCSNDADAISAGSGNVQEDDDSGLSVDSVHFFQNIKVPYIPIAYEDAPNWLKPILDESERGKVNMTVIRGKWNGKYVYNVHDDQMSILIGKFLDQDGNQLDVVEFESLIYETVDWTCIVNYRFY